MDGRIQCFGIPVVFWLECMRANGFDWLAHIVLNESFEVVNACLAKYSEVWPEIQKKTGKVGYNTSSSLPGSIDITSNIQNSQKEINNR